MNFMKFFFTISFIAVLVGCQTQSVRQTSSDRLYKKENNELNAQFVVYHVNDSVSQLFYKISNETIVYKKTDTSTAFYSNIKLFLRISNDETLDVIRDTASDIIYDRQTQVKVRDLIGSFYFTLKHGSKYHVNIDVFDVNKKVKYTQNVFADKTSKETRQNFLITNWAGEVSFNSYYKPEEVVYIKSDRNQEKVFMTDYFEYKFNVALPPFTLSTMPQFQYKPEYSKSLYLKNDRFELELPKSGLVHLKTNSETKEGVTFFIYESSFPKIKNAEQMVLATRYIMAKKEFDNCINASDKKVAIDAFWLEIAGSNERAKELIKRYYGRVQEANRLFTSYQEGWKTDRGMIYIVFGAPNKVSTRKNGEIWTYGEVGNPNSIVFTFNKVSNPFTDNDYYLERNEFFKMPWYQAVDMWRQGRIYIDN